MHPVRTRRATLAIICVVVALLWPLVSAAAQLRTVEDPPLEEKLICLTFDDGPDPQYTQAVLDILNDEGVPGTFFLVGSKVIADEGRTDYTGHLVGYHTYTHPDLLSLSEAEQIAEFERCRSVFPASYDTRAGYYRAPYGRVSSATVAWANSTGVYLPWDVAYDRLIHGVPAEGVDPQILGHDARVAALVAAVSHRDIVLLHDGNRNGVYLVEDLRDIIRKLKAAGYRFVTPEGLPDTGSPQTRNGA